MPTIFTLCPECLAQYAALEFREDARIRASSIPFNCIYWEDEHPVHLHWPLLRHPQCLMSMLQLSQARTTIWWGKSLPEPLSVLWEEAKSALPNWPGFRRLKLTRQAYDVLRTCWEETESIMSVTRRSGRRIEVTEKDGIAHIKAHPKDPPPG